MTRRKDAFGLRMSVEGCMKAALETAALEGWKVKSQGDSQLVLKESWGFSAAMPTKMKVILKGDSPDITRVTIKGKKFGYGPFQARPLNRQIENFRRRMELAATQGSKTDERRAEADAGTG